jgi:tetratricopeptide (TPR) repeat protein
MAFKEIKELRQAGKLDEALQMAHQALEADPNNIWNKRAVAWVYYDFLKKFAQPDSYDAFKENLIKIKDLQLPEDEKMVFDKCAWQIGKLVFALQEKDPVDFSKINELFNIIKGFHFTKPSEAYSFIYKAFHKGYQNWSSYLTFADWWNFENFRPEDYLKEETNGNIKMSLAEQAYIAYSKKLLEGEPLDAFGQLREID